MVDDVAGDLLLRARELVEALGDVVGEALCCGTRTCRGLGHGGGFRPARAPFPPVGSSPHRPGLRLAAPPAPICLYRARMTAEELLRQTNRNMIAFDLALGTAAIVAPAATLRVLGHDTPSTDAEDLFRAAGRSGSPSPPPTPSPSGAATPTTGGRSPGCAGPSSPPTRCGRARRRSAAPARRRGCGWPASPTWR